MGCTAGSAAQILLDWLAAGWKELLVHELIRNGEDSVGWRGDLAIDLVAQPLAAAQRRPLGA